MEDFVYYSALYDLYKGLLTERQREVFESYFFENWTTEEIALHDGISKSAVAKTIKQIKISLDEIEDKVHFFRYKKNIVDELKNDKDLLNRIIKYDNMDV